MRSIDKKGIDTALAELRTRGVKTYRSNQMRDKIRLVSSAGTGHFYTTTKNKRNMPDKMEIRKFDPKARKHVMYKEAKIK